MSERTNMVGFAGRKDEDAEEVFYHLGLESLEPLEFFQLMREGKIENNGALPTVDVFLDLVERGKRIHEKQKNE